MAAALATSTTLIAPLFGPQNAIFVKHEYIWGEVSMAKIQL